jgi:antitoxin MazE
MRIAKWGNIRAIRLKAAVVEVLDLTESEEVEARVADRRTFDVDRHRRHERALAYIRAARGKLPPDWKFDRDEANAS